MFSTNLKQQAKVNSQHCEQIALRNLYNAQFHVGSASSQVTKFLDVEAIAGDSDEGSSSEELESMEGKLLLLKPVAAF
jgi:hypothetical protein